MPYATKAAAGVDIVVTESSEYCYSFTSRVSSVPSGEVVEAQIGGAFREELSVMEKYSRTPESVTIS